MTIMTKHAAKIVGELHAEDLRACMAAFQLARNNTLRKMLFYFLGALILGIVLFALTGMSFWALLSIALLTAWGIVWQRFGSAGQQLGQSLLEAMAERSKAQFVPGRFSPPTWPRLAELLSHDTQSFRPRFFNLLRVGTGDNMQCQIFDADIYQARGFRRGRRSVHVFEGQFYQFPRATTSRGTTLFVTRGRKIAVPVQGPHRYEKLIPDNSAMKHAFDIYSTDPAEARQLLEGSRLCQELLQVAQAARRQQVIALIEPDYALLAIEGPMTPLRRFRLRSGIDASIERSGDYLRGTIAKATSLAAALS